jgi:A/G-specific adenine glycosylase
MNSFSAVIIRWFREYGRDLPWRETRDPYAIWLSEIILQQTRIVQGWEYWERFMKTYPKVEDLAAASEDDVLKLWQGLGYYSRARNLHAAAKQIVELGHFPDTLEGIKALKGVGDYTAAAIGSFAFDISAAVVDGIRILGFAPRQIPTILTKPMDNDSRKTIHKIQCSK